MRVLFPKVKDSKHLWLFAAGLVVAVVVWLIPIPELPLPGRRCLALSLCAVVWWAGGVMNPGFTALALLLAYTLLLDSDKVTSQVIFGLWTSPTMYLVIGGFLIAAAVETSNLGKRLALLFLNRFVHSYRGLVLSCYCMSLALSVVIPHPWPRSFLLLLIMRHAASCAGLDQRQTSELSLAVFVASIPTSMILLTGDSTLNPIVAGFAGETLSWVQWFKLMAVPGLIASVLTFVVQYNCSPKPAVFQFQRQDITEELRQLGGLSRAEKTVLLVMMGTVILWASDSLHGIHPGWITLLAALVLASPLGKVLDASSLPKVPVGTLFFLCAALSIGKVGEVTGMNMWLAKLLLPQSGGFGPVVFALVATGLCMLLHAGLGSTLAVLGIAAPTIVSFGQAVGVPPLAAALISYTAVACHWILPFHHMNLLVGCGKKEGGYTQKQVLRLAAPQTLVVFIVVLLEIAWWKLIGLL